MLHNEGDDGQKGEKLMGSCITWEQHLPVPVICLIHFYRLRCVRVVPQ